MLIIKKDICRWINILNERSVPKFRLWQLFEKIHYFEFMTDAEQIQVFLA